MTKEEQQILRDSLALCPLDGRDSEIAKELRAYFSEYAFMKARFEVEMSWFLYLLNEVKMMELNAETIAKLEILAMSFTPQSYLDIKILEQNMKSDAKAVQYYIGEKLCELNLEPLVSLVNIGCTTDDINNIAYAVTIQKGLNDVWIKYAEELRSEIRNIAVPNINTSMLAFTHGQPATPTTVGKELAVVYYRLGKTIEKIKNNKIEAKFNGTTGNYSAIDAAFPDINWLKESKNFIEGYMGLSFNPVTTQIENHDYMTYLFDYMRHFNNIVKGFDQDMWMYIGKDYYRLKTIKKEVNPQKINTIYFENSEANIKMANYTLEGLSNDLSISRMQGDLSNSYLQRNIGMVFGYSIQGIKKTIDGLKKITVNYDQIEKELNDHFEVLAEPMQTILRKYGIPDAYDELKEFGQETKLNKMKVKDYINRLPVADIDKIRLFEMTPGSYTGYASSLADAIFKAPIEKNKSDSKKSKNNNELKK